MTQNPKFKVGDWVRILPSPPGVPRLKHHVSGDIGVIIRGPFRHPYVHAPADWPCYRLDISPSRSAYAGLNEVCLELIPPPEDRKTLMARIWRPKAMGA